MTRNLCLALTHFWFYFLKKNKAAAREYETKLKSYKKLSIARDEARMALDNAGNRLNALKQRQKKFLDEVKLLLRVFLFNIDF